jgi:centromere protein I
LHRRIFKPLESRILDSPASKLEYFTLYIRLLRHWRVLLRSLDTIPAQAASIVSKLVELANLLALSILQTNPTVPAFGLVLEFYEETAATVADPVLMHHLRITIPKAQLVYLIVFGPSLANTARLCGVLAIYKRCFEKAMAKPASGQHDALMVNSTSYDTGYVDTFNGFLMDIVNCIYRLKAFNKTDTNALGCKVSDHAIEQLSVYVSSLDFGGSLASLFGLSFSPILCLQSITCIQELENEAFENGQTITVRHPGPVTSATLARNAERGGIQLTYQQYRIHVLERLDRNGQVGIPELMRNTMKNLQGKDGRTTT